MSDENQPKTIARRAWLSMLADPMVHFSPDTNPPTNGDTEPGNPTGGDNPGSESNPTGGNPAATFTQADVDAAVSKRLARERQKTERELSQLGIGNFDELQERLAKVKEHEEEQLLKDRNFEELLARVRAEKDAKIAELEGLYSTSEQQRTQAAIERELLGAVAHTLAPEQVVALLRNSVSVNAEGRLDVVDAQGNPQLDGQGNPLSVKQHIDNFLNKNPHFLPSVGGRGAGTGRTNGSGIKTGFDPSKKHDPAHLTEHRDEIIELMKAGKLEG